jgi:uncharacterized circularly permuted ATP-grasp superfamily protein
MPSVATWWCGEEAALEFTIEHLDQLVIKGLTPRSVSIRSSAMNSTGSKREEMIARLRARPQAYVAQELVNFSQAPAWRYAHPAGWLPRGVGLRVFRRARPTATS